MGSVVYRLIACMQERNVSLTKGNKHILNIKKNICIRTGLNTASSAFEY